MEVIINSMRGMVRTIQTEVIESENSIPGMIDCTVQVKLSEQMSGIEETLTGLKNQISVLRDETKAEMQIMKAEMQRMEARLYAQFDVRLEALRGAEARMYAQFDARLEAGSAAVRGAGSGVAVPDWNGISAP